MKFSRSTYRKNLAVAAFVLACSAILAPAASAMIPDPDVREAAAGTSDVVRPDDRPTQGIGSAGEPRPVPWDSHDFVAPASDAGLADETPVGTPDPADSLPSWAYYAHDVGATASDAGLADMTEVNPDGVAPVSGGIAAPATPQPPIDTGFDWGDAGIGIAIGTAAGVMLVGLLLLGRSRTTLRGA
jgi:hypothetical protein